MQKVTQKRVLFISWLFWHYHEALKEIILRWRDFLRFNLYYFSTFDLMRTLFSPWRGYKSTYGRGFDAAVYAEAILFNTFSRLIGGICRLILIIISIIVELFVFVIGLLLVIGWLLMPVIIFVGLFNFIEWLISS